jgi:hypothetical protein
MSLELARFMRRGLRQGTWPLLQRYAVARRILDLPPVTVAAHSDFTLHLRVCERDAVMAHWALRSFLLHASVPCAVTIHDDGSCRPQTLRQFATAFRHCQVYGRDEAYRAIAPQLASFEALAEWARRDYAAIKWLDVYLLGRSRHVIFLDSDVLFFADPVALFAAGDHALWMKDCFRSLYIDDDEAALWYGVPRLPQLNSGLGRIPRHWFDAALAADVLRRLQSPALVERAAARGLPGRDDQTFNAVLAACKGAWRYLPDDYCLAMEPGLGACVARHYVGPRRFGFYEEGLPRVARQLGLKLPRWLSERA